MQKSKWVNLSSKAGSRVFKISVVSAIAFSIFVCFLFPEAVNAVHDPPHNEASSVNCESCHGKSLILLDTLDNPINSPFWSENSSDEAYNSICRRCHLTGTNIGNGDGYKGGFSPFC